jgi:predicted enzyme related to lactoylglutathione lyase
MAGGISTMFTFSPHIAVQVHDHEAACNFYERVLGMQRMHTADGSCDGREVAFRKDAVMFYVEEGVKGATFFEFRVDDIIRAEAVLLEAGCVVTHQYNEKSKMIADPYGLRFHIWQAMVVSDTPVDTATPHKNYLLRCIETEIGSCKHLYTTIPEGMLDFRPRENMRTMEELLRYLTWTGVSTIAHYLNDLPEGITHARKYYSERNADLDLCTFPVAMDAQMAEIRAKLAAITDEELITRRVMYPWGVETSLGEAIVETTVKWLSAYKMQLFLYIKMAGSDINTMDCWIAPYNT